MIGESVVDIR